MSMITADYESVPEFSNNAKAVDRAWLKLLVLWAILSALVCVYSVAGIMYGQRKYGITELFAPATGTSFYDDHFIELPMKLLFGLVLFWTITGGTWLCWRRSWKQAILLLVTLWPCFVAVGAVMVCGFWEPASP